MTTKQCMWRQNHINLLNIQLKSKASIEHPLCLYVIHEHMQKTCLWNILNILTSVLLTKKHAYSSTPFLLILRIIKHKPNNQALTNWRLNRHGGYHDENYQDNSPLFSIFISQYITNCRNTSDFAESNIRTDILAETNLRRLNLFM